MSNKNSVTELSKFIALILRHQPSAAEITLDENGWAQTSALIAGVNKTGRVLDMPLLKQIVNTDEKGRYSFNADFTKIRANQGHSDNVCVEMERRVPPPELFHGTAERFLESIAVSGILRKSRNYVHLSADVNTAFKVGARHGKPAVLVIDARAMSAEGFVFYLSANGVWQSQDIPPRYIKNVLKD